MPIPRRYTTDAIVLSRFDLGEADRVLTLITPDRRQAQGHRQGRPPADLAAGRQPRAVRRADRRRWRAAGRSTSSPRSASGTPGSTCAIRSNRRPPPGTSPSSPTARSRSATRPSRSTRCCAGRTSCSTPGWRPDGWRAGTRCTCSTSSASAPRSTAASNATGSSRPTSASAGCRRSAGVLCERCPGPAARPDRHHARGAQAAQGLPASRHRGDRRAAAGARRRARDRGRAARLRARSPSSATPGRWRSSTRSGRRARSGRSPS